MRSVVPLGAWIVFDVVAVWNVIVTEVSSLEFGGGGCCCCCCVSLEVFDGGVVDETLVEERSCFCHCALCHCLIEK